MTHRSVQDASRPPVVFPVLRLRAANLAVLATLCCFCPSSRAQYTQEPYEVHSVNKDSLRRVRSYCLYLKGDSDYPSHDPIVWERMRRSAGASSGFAGKTRWRYNPRCSEADVSITVLIMREETSQDEDAGPKAFRHDAWVGIFVEDERKAEKLDSDQKAGRTVRADETEALVIVSVVGHGDGTSTLEQVSAGKNPYREPLYDATDEALYGIEEMTTGHAD